MGRLVYVREVRDSRWIWGASQLTLLRIVRPSLALAPRAVTSVLPGVVLVVASVVPMAAPAPAPVQVVVNFMCRTFVTQCPLLAKF